MAVTAADVARHCGVSRHTIGGVLGPRAHRFSAATRAKVEAAVAELGYRPHPGSRAIRTGRSHCLALLCDPDWQRTYMPQQLLHGIIDAAEQRGLHVAVVRCRDQDLSRTVPLLPSTLMADAVIINYHQPVLELQELLNGLAVPTVWVNAEYAEAAVAPNDHLAGYLATHHLVQAGHRRIAVVSAWPAQFSQTIHSSHAQRKQGYRQAMQEAGLTPSFLEPASPLVYGNESQWFTKILSAADRPTAVILVDGSREIIDARIGAAQAGLHIPAHLSVVVIHNEAQQVGGLLTTVVLPWRAIAERCVGYLHEQISRQSSLGSQTVLPRVEIAPHIAQPTASVAELV